MNTDGPTSRLGPGSTDPPAPTGRKLDITYPTTEFVKQLKNWESFEPGSMAIVIAHVKSYVFAFTTETGSSPFAAAPISQTMFLAPEIRLPQNNLSEQNPRCMSG